MAFSWKVVYDGKTPPPGEVVRPDERLSWGRTVGLGAQHVVAMFGATFVFPIIMGLNPQLAILMSGVATICFLLIVQGKVPSYLGTSASFVGGVAAIRAQGGDERGGHRRDLHGRCAPRDHRADHPLLRLPGDLHRAAAGRHRRGRHAHRVQPCSGRCRHLLAAGPVGGADHDDLRHRLLRRLARLCRSHLDLPRARVRVRRVVAVRPHLRPDHVIRPSHRRGEHPLPDQLRRRHRC